MKGMKRFIPSRKVPFQLGVPFCRSLSPLTPNLPLDYSKMIAYSPISFFNNENIVSDDLLSNPSDAPEVIVEKVDCIS